MISKGQTRARGGGWKRPIFKLIDPSSNPCAWGRLDQRPRRERPATVKPVRVGEVGPREQGRYG